MIRRIALIPFLVVSALSSAQRAAAVENPIHLTFPIGRLYRSDPEAQSDCY